MSDYFIHKNGVSSVYKHILCVCCCDRHQFDQITKLGGRSLVEISTKLRHPQCRSLVEVWCRSLVGIFLSSLQCISLICRANFDQTSTLGVSKFGRSLVEVWSKFRHLGCRSLVEVSTNLRHPHRSTYIICSTTPQTNSLFLEKYIIYVVR